MPKISWKLLLFCYRILREILKLWTCKPIQIDKPWECLSNFVLKMNHVFGFINNLKKNWNHLTNITYIKWKINTKCRNRKNKNGRCKWKHSNKIMKLYRMVLRLLGWPNPSMLRVWWRKPSFRRWKWHQTSLFDSIQVHPC